MRVALPILTPISGHGLPPGSRPFDRNRMDISCTRDVGDQNQVEEGVAVDGKPDTSLLSTGHPSVSDGHDPGTILSNLQESWLGEVEVLAGRIAPPAIVIGQCEVWRAKVCGGDCDGATQTPFRVTVASHLIAGPAG